MRTRDERSPKATSASEGNECHRTNHREGLLPRGYSLRRRTPALARLKHCNTNEDLAAKGPGPEKDQSWRHARDTSTHPAFNLFLRVNFVNGTGEDSGFRFTGDEGVMTIGGNGVGIGKHPRDAEPGYTIGTFPEALQAEFLKEYHEKYPAVKPTAEGMKAAGDEQFSTPQGYSDNLDHFTNFFASVRSRQQPVEDATFGLRAAGPALLSNVSYFDGWIVEWDPEAMRVIH